MIFFSNLFMICNIDQVGQFFSNIMGISFSSAWTAFDFASLYNFGFISDLGVAKWFSLTPRHLGPDVVLGELNHLIQGLLIRFAGLLFVVV